MKRGNPRAQKWILRIMAMIVLPMVPTLCAPPLTVEKLSWLLGFGQPPKTPLLPYLAAGGSFVYLALSALLWMISCDVLRYRPLVVFSGWLCLAGGPVYGWIDTVSGMPLWWLMMDALSCFIGGLALLWAVGREEAKPL